MPDGASTGRMMDLKTKTKSSLWSPALFKLFRKYILEFALRWTDRMWSFYLSDWLTITPTSLNFVTRSTSSPWILTVGSWLLHSWPIISSIVFLVFMFSLLSSALCTSSLHAHCILHDSSACLATNSMTVVSSTNVDTGCGNFRSVIIIGKHRSPSQDPSGMPPLSVNHLDVVDPSLTRCFLSFRNERIRITSWRGAQDLGACGRQLKCRHDQML